MHGARLSAPVSALLYDELTVCQHCGDSYLYDAIAWQEDGEGNYICEYCAEELEAEEEQ